MVGFNRTRNPDWLVAVLLWLGSLCVFANGASRLGFYYDDGGFIATLPVLHSVAALRASISAYVPGRNLHILWQYLFFVMVGNNPVAHLAALHRIQAVFDSFAVVLFYLLLRRLRLSIGASMMAATLFAFWPVHGETHFWMSALPMNILSTIFVLIFALTSVSLAGGHRETWIWTVDLACFWCAALTYDQTLGAIFVIAGARVFWVFLQGTKRRLAFLAMHAAHVTAGIVFLWLRLTARAGTTPMVSWGPGLWNRIQSNVISSVWANTRRLPDELHGGVDGGDGRLVAFGVVLIFFAVSVCFLRARYPSGLSIRMRFLLIALAVAFWVAAYLPVWFWYLSPRHNYLPTLGLFCALAVLLDWLERIDTHRVLMPATLLVLSAVAGLGGAALLVESRYWQESFSAKRKLFEDLSTQLAGKSALVLEGFPSSDGPAMFITPHDSFLGARLLLPNVPLGAGFQGALTAARSVSGIALGAGPSTIVRPLPDDAVLWVRFVKFQEGVLHYSIVNLRD